MATLNAILDPVPLTAPAPAGQTPNPDATPAQSVARQGLASRFLHRWPFLVLGLIVGLGLGFLYASEQPTAYRSTAQLVVAPNPGLATAAPSTADPITDRMLLLQSEKVLKRAAERRLDEQKPFQSPPPTSMADRIAFLGSHFTVSRQKEPGSNAPGNVLVLTFEATDAADAPRYLRAILDAYRDELVAMGVEASTQQVKRIDAQIAELRKVQVTADAERRVLRDKVREVAGTASGQDERAAVVARLATSRASATALKLREAALARELADFHVAVDAAPNTRAARLAVMAKLGVQPDRPVPGVELRDPDTLLSNLLTRKLELSTKLGPAHPDMVALNAQIKPLVDEIDKRGGPPDDELERHRRKLESEQTVILAQLALVSQEIAADENRVRRVTALQWEIAAFQATSQEAEGQIAAKDTEKEQVRNASVATDVKESQPPTSGVAVTSNLGRSLLLGGGLGLLFGGFLAMGVSLAARPARTAVDALERLDMPLLGHLSPTTAAGLPEVMLAAKIDPSLVAALRPRSGEADAVRRVHTQVLLRIRGEDHQVIQVTSPSPGEGKSTLAANLAISLAQANKRVVLVDCDFRKPRIHRLFDLPESDLGLAAVIADQADLGNTVQSCEIENLSLLPCGARPVNPTELLTSPRLQDLIGDLREIYDLVILDTPSVLTVPDAATLARRTDGVILVLRMVRDVRPAQRAREKLNAAGGRVLGVVVNASPGAT